jgi:transcriptional regulator with XRE-family HTH domain
MQYLAQIRKKLNLSFGDLAEYLKISRAHIQLAEIGKRRLKGNELLFASNLKVLVLNKDMDKNAPDYSNENELAEMETELESRISDLETQLDKRREELQKMERQYKQVCTSLPYYDHIQSHLLHLSLSQRNWLQKNREFQEKLIQSSGLSAQHKLKFRIQSLGDEILYHRNAMKKMG